MGSIRDLRKLVGRLTAGGGELQILEQEAVRLRVELEKAFSVGEQIPPRKRLRRANALCKAANIVLSLRNSLRNEPSMQATFNGTLHKLEKAVGRVEEQRERFLAAHPELQRRIRRRQ